MIKRQDEPPSIQPRVHHLGDGLHPIPIYRIVLGAKIPLYSEPCIHLLFVIWAHRKGFDPVSIYSKSNPQKPFLRPDRLLALRSWTHIPETIDTQLLLNDLKAIDEHELCIVIGQIEAGTYAPEPAYTHWVVTDEGQIAGEARHLDPPEDAPPPEKPDDQGQHFCYVRLFAMPECAEWGYTNASNLRAKHDLFSGAQQSTTKP